MRNSALPFFGGTLFPFLPQRAKHQIWEFGRGGVAGEVAAGAEGFAEIAVEALDGVGRVEHAPDLQRIEQARSEPLPRALPDGSDLRNARAPLRLQVRQHGQGSGFTRGLVDRAQIRRDGLPLLPAFILEALPREVDEILMHDRLQKDSREGVGQAHQAVHLRDQDVLHAAGLELAAHAMPEAHSHRLRDPLAQHLLRAIGQTRPARDARPCSARPLRSGSSRATRRTPPRDTPAPAAGAATS